MKKFNISAILSLSDKLSAPLKKLSTSVMRFSNKTRDSFSKLDNLSFKRLLLGARVTFGKMAGFARSAAGKMAKALGGITLGAIGGGFALNELLIKDAAFFEDLQKSMEGIRGSKSQALKDVQWIKDFGKTTPFEMAPISESFKNAIAMGLDPTSGLFDAVGDAAATLGKNFDEMFVKLRSGMTGEFEGLKEIGIFGSAAKGQSTISHKNKQGQMIRETFAKTDMLGIAGAIERAMRDKFSGGMLARQDTWNAKMSNFMDTITDYKTKLMLDGGVLDAMKRKMDLLLGDLETGDFGGKLKKWGEDITRWIDGITVHDMRGFFEQVKEAAKSLIVVFGFLKKSIITLSNLIDVVMSPSKWVDRFGKGLTQILGSGRQSSGGRNRSRRGSLLTENNQRPGNIVNLQQAAKKLEDAKQAHKSPKTAFKSEIITKIEDHRTTQTINTPDQNNQQVVNTGRSLRGRNRSR